MSAVGPTSCLGKTADASDRQRRVEFGDFAIAYSSSYIKSPTTMDWGDQSHQPVDPEVRAYVYSLVSAAS